MAEPLACHLRVTPGLSIRHVGTLTVVSGGRARVAFGMSPNPVRYLLWRPDSGELRHLTRADGGSTGMLGWCAGAGETANWR